MSSIAARLPDGWQSMIPSAWLDGWAPQTSPLSGGTTEIVIMGAGPTLVLLPPLPGYKEAFVGVASKLARRFRVVTFDLRIRFPNRPSWTVLLDDLDQIADSLGDEPLILAGHSLGGALAQQWALRNPSRVSALVLSSSFAHVGSVPGHGWKRYVEQPIVLAGQRWLPTSMARSQARNLARRGAWVYDPFCDEHILDFIRFAIRNVPVSLAGQSVRLALAHDTRATLGQLEHPTLSLVGERETRWARKAEEELAQLIDQAERRVAPGVGHLHPLSSPEWFSNTVTSYWNSVRSRTGTAAKP